MCPSWNGLWMQGMKHALYFLLNDFTMFYMQTMAWTIYSWSAEWYYDRCMHNNVPNIQFGYLRSLPWCVHIVYIMSRVRP